MKILKKIPIITLISLLFMSIFTQPALAMDVGKYMPSSSAVEGYDLIWSSYTSVLNPINTSAGNIEAASQIWANKSGDDVQNVVGAVAIEIPNNPMSIIANDTLVGILNTTLDLDLASGSYSYWDIMMACLDTFDFTGMISFNVNNITAEIGTTNSSFEIKWSLNLLFIEVSYYFILSKDEDVIFMTFAMSSSNDWIEYVQNHDDDIQKLMNISVNLVISLLTIWDLALAHIETFVQAHSEFTNPFLSIVDEGSPFEELPSAASVPVSAAAPVGSLSSEDAVKMVTKGIGQDVGSLQIPGFEITLVVFSIFTGIAIIYFKNKKKFRK